MVVETLRATSLPICFFFMFLFRCTAPPPLTMETFPKRLSAFQPIDSICMFKAFGDMKLSLSGERHSANIDVLWQNDAHFTIALSSPFGGTIASIAADSSGVWNIAAGDSLFKKSPHDMISLGGVLDYSLTFSDFLRIATGRLLDTTILQEPSDSLSCKGKKAFLYWHGDSINGRLLDITVVIDRKHFSITDVIYSKKKPSLWELSSSRAKSGAPEEIRFKDQNNNYFYLKYGKVVVKRDKQCR